MTLSVSSTQGVKVYNLSAGKTLPEWLKEAKSSRALRKNADFSSRIELIQDLEFPVSSGKIKMSECGKYLVTTGIYPPQVKVFELADLSLKFERHIDSEVVQFHVLTDDFSKMVFLRDDRTVEFHARYGTHHKLRVPRFGRDLMYQPSVCDLYVVGDSPEAWRINLEQGRFLKGIDTSLSEINCCDMNPVHELLAFGGADNAVVMHDPRDRASIGTLYVPSKVGEADVTAFRFDHDGRTCAVGTSNGEVLVYDIRSSKPLQKMDHRYDEAIKDIRFHAATNRIVSTDGKGIKFWNKTTNTQSKLWTTIQPPQIVNDLCLVEESGLLFSSCEASRVQTYYLPELGPAPSWCSFLDSITEELEEERGSVLYDDYKFVTREELSSLGLDSLIGSNLLKAYMHGFFMDMRLWTQVQSLSKPFEYEEYMKKRVKDKMEAARPKRVQVQRELPRVNTVYAETLSKSDKNTDRNPLRDSRFSGMFTDEAFTIDPESEEYKRLHPRGSKMTKQLNARHDLLYPDEDGPTMIPIREGFAMPLKDEGREKEIHVPLADRLKKAK